MTADRYAQQATCGVGTYGGATYGSAPYLRGGGTVAETATKHAIDSIATSGGGSMSATVAFGVVAALSGGGALAATERPGRLGAFALSGGGALTAIGHLSYLATFFLSGGGALAMSGAKHAIAVMDAEAIYGVASYGDSVYGTLPHISGGGATASIAVTEHFGAFVLGGGGATAAVVAIHRSGPASISGGGTLTAVDTKKITGAVNLSSGGQVDCSGIKHAFATDADETYGVGTYGELTYGTSITSHIAGGGTPTAANEKNAHASITSSDGGSEAATGSRIAYSVVSMSAGGAAFGDGIKHAFTVTVQDIYGSAIYGTSPYGPGLFMTGGGRLWGPFPIVLSPQVRIFTGESRVAIKTGESKAKVFTESLVLTKA